MSWRPAGMNRCYRIDEEMIVNERGIAAEGLVKYLCNGELSDSWIAVDAMAWRVRNGSTGDIGRIIK